MRTRLFITSFLLLLNSVQCIANTAHFNVDLVKVDKSSRTMWLYSGDTVVKKYHIALGDNPKGHKQQEGDNRTPEGEYVLDYKKYDSSFYRAMHISYPNERDIKSAQQKGVSPGGFIMIHGQKNGDTKNPKKLQRFNWTNGCIALTNPEMDEFLQLVNSGTKIDIIW